MVWLIATSCWAMRRRVDSSSESQIYESLHLGILIVAILDEGFYFCQSCQVLFQELDCPGDIRIVFYQCAQNVTMSIQRHGYFWNIEHFVAGVKVMCG